MPNIIGGVLLLLCLSASLLAAERHGLPPHLFTDDPAVFDAQSRIQVDVGQTGFFQGREFRVTRKIRLASGEEVVFKNVLNVDIIIQRFAFQITDGNYEVHVWTSDNVTEVDDFATVVPFAPKNASSEFKLYDGARYVSQMQIFTSGAVLAGNAITVTDAEQYIDYLEMKTSNATAHAAGVAGASDTFRYTPSPVTFYTQISCIGTGTCRGVINNEWEERPADNDDWLTDRFGRYK